MSSQESQTPTTTGATAADDDAATTTTTTTTILSPKSLLLASTPLLIVAAIGGTDLAQHSLGVPTNLSTSLVEGCFRTIIQLSLLGSSLRPIFQANSPALVLAYISFMITLAAYETASRTTYQFDGQFRFVLTSLAANVGWVAAWAFGVILRVKPYWWNPRYVIPIIGMLLGNSIPAISLSLNSLTTSLVENQAEIDLWLALGATPTEASKRLIKQAIQAGTTPILNTMRVIGIISIPGMMTGQLLGGSTTIAAAKYQIFIILMIATCVVAVVLTNAFCLVEFIGFDPNHAFLHTHRLTKNKRHSVTKVLTLLLGGMMTSSPSSKDLSFVQQQQHNNHGGPESDINAEYPATTFSETIQQPPLEIRHLIQRAETSSCFDSSSSSEAAETNSCDRNMEQPILDSSIVLNVQGAAKSFMRTTSSSEHSQSYQRTLFQDLSFQIALGDLVLIKGPSGSGKSTLLRGLAGLSPLDEGLVSLGSSNWEQDFATHTLAATWRRQVRYVVQETKLDNIPGTPSDIIEQMCNFYSWKYSPKEKNDFLELIKQYLKQWGSLGGGGPQQHPHDDDTLLHQEWSKLSGGETQRILIAITLASQPSFVLFDESTSALDKESKMAVEASVKAFVQDRKGGVLWISHDEEQAERMSTI